MIKKKSSSNNIDFEIGDLDNLENELNELSGSGSSKPVYASSGETKTLGGFAANLFGLGNSQSAQSSKSVNLDDEYNDSKLGQSTAETMGTTKTWDGFVKMNEIPIGGDKGLGSSSSSNMTDRERRRKKRMMIKKLEEWYEIGLIK